MSDDFYDGSKYDRHVLVCVALLLFAIGLVCGGAIVEIAFLLF